MMIKNIFKQNANNKKKNDNRGFTLVEVIISIAALGIICAVLLRLFVVAADTNDTAANAQHAEQTAASTVETLVGAESIANGLTALGISPSNSVFDSYSLHRDGTTLTIVIEDAGGDYPGMLYSISATVSSLDDNILANIFTKKYERSVAYE